MNHKTMKWTMLFGALAIASCASAPQIRYADPLPVPSKGKSNLQFLNETEKLSINEIQKKINTEQPAINCKARVKDSPHTVEDVKPLVRIPPIMPSTMNVSGYCQVRFTVTKIGTTRDIELLLCTHEVLARPSIQSVSKWTYAPKTINGENHDRCGNEARIHFIRHDKRGRKRSVPEGF